MKERAAAEAAEVKAADGGVITSGSLRWAPSLKADLWAEGAKYRLPLSKRRREEIKVDDSNACMYMSPVNPCRSAGGGV